MTLPLFVTGDEALLEELLRLAAAAGVTPEVAPDAGTALRSWLPASLVLVGLDQAAAVAALAPPRRPGVHVVSAGAPPDEVFRTALRLGAEHVAELARSEGWLVELLTDLVDPVGARGLTIGVIGGCGGAGASTFACALGQVGGRRGRALVVDADPRGPGLDRLLGLEEEAGVRWESLEQTTGRLSASSLRDAVPSRDGVGVLTWRQQRPTSLQAFAAREALSAAQRGHDTVVLDLPRAADPLTEELVTRCDRIVVVTTATVPALAATARLCGRLPVAARSLVLRGAGVAAGEVSRLTGVRDVVPMAPQRRLDESVDLGLGPIRARRGPLFRAASAVLAQAGAAA